MGDAFVDPVPEVGDLIYWFPGASRPSLPFCGIVTRVGANGSVSCTCFPADYSVSYPKDGVKHVDDPSIKKSEQDEFGAWDFSPKQKAMNKIIADLSAKVDEPVAKKKQAA